MLLRRKTRCDSSRCFCNTSRGRSLPMKQMHWSEIQYAPKEALSHNPVLPPTQEFLKSHDSPKGAGARSKPPPTPTRMPEQQLEKRLFEQKYPGICFLPPPPATILAVIHPAPRTAFQLRFFIVKKLGEGSYMRREPSVSLRHPLKSSAEISGA